MIYSDQLYNKLSKEVATMVQFLQECKYSGSYETKLDLGNVVRLISNQENLIKHLRLELQTKTTENETLKNKLRPESVL